MTIERVTAGHVLSAAITCAAFAGLAVLTYSYTTGLVLRIIVGLAVLSGIGVIVTFQRASRGEHTLKHFCKACGHEQSGALPSAARWEDVKRAAKQFGLSLEPNVFVLYGGGLYRCKKRVTAKVGKDSDHWEQVGTPDYDSLPDELKSLWYYG